MQNKILKKLFNTTVTMFIILTILTINKTSNTNTLRTNLEIENITNISTDNIYLLNDDNLLAISLLVRLSISRSNISFSLGVKILFIISPKLFYEVYLIRCRLFILKLYSYI